MRMVILIEIRATAAMYSPRNATTKVSVSETIARVLKEEVWPLTKKQYMLIGSPSFRVRLRQELRQTPDQ